MYCPRCASKVKTGAAACKKCGFVFYEREQPVPPQAPPATAAAESFPAPEQAPAYDDIRYGAQAPSASPHTPTGGGQFPPPRYGGEPQPAHYTPAERPRGRLPVVKLILGIVGIVLSAYVLYQSYLASILTNLAGIFTEVNDTSAVGGMVLATCMLAAGVVGIVTRRGKVGGIVAGILYILGGAFGILNRGLYGDLIIWSAVSIAFGLVFLISCLTINSGMDAVYPQQPDIPPPIPDQLPYQAIGIPTLARQESYSQDPQVTQGGEARYGAPHRPLATRWWFWLIVAAAALAVAAAALVLFDIDIGGGFGRGDSARDPATDEAPLDVSVQEYIGLVNGYLGEEGVSLRVPEVELIGETLASWGEEIVLTYVPHPQNDTVEYLEGIVVMSVGEQSLEALLSSLIRAADPSASRERAVEMAADMVETATQNTGEQYTVERGGVYYALLCGIDTGQYNVMVASVDYVRGRLAAAAAAEPQPEPEPETDEDDAGAGAHSFGRTLAYGDLEITFLQDIVWDAVVDESGDSGGTTVFLVPVTIHNSSDAAQDSSVLLYDQYGPDGQVLEDVRGLVDGAEFSRIITSGETMDTGMPFLYTGDGIYSVQFILDGEVVAEASLPIQREAAAAGETEETADTGETEEAQESQAQQQSAESADADTQSDEAPLLPQLPTEPAEPESL